MFAKNEIFKRGKRPPSSSNSHKKPDRRSETCPNSLGENPIQSHAIPKKMFNTRETHLLAGTRGRYKRENTR